MEYPAQPWRIIKTWTSYYVFQSTGARQTMHAHIVTIMPATPSYYHARPNNHYWWHLFVVLVVCILWQSCPLCTPQDAVDIIIQSLHVNIFDKFNALRLMPPTHSFLSIIFMHWYWAYRLKRHHLPHLTKNSGLFFCCGASHRCWCIPSFTMMTLLAQLLHSLFHAAPCTIPRYVLFFFFVRHLISVNAFSAPQQSHVLCM